MNAVLTFQGFLTRYSSAKGLQDGAQGEKAHPATEQLPNTSTVCPNMPRLTPPMKKEINTINKSGTVFYSQKVKMPTSHTPTINAMSNQQIQWNTVAT